MASIFKSIVRGFKNSHNHLKSQNNFMGNFMKTMAENDISEEETKVDKKTYFNEPLAGNLNNFNKTTDISEELPKPESNSAESQAKRCAVPFMITRNMKMDLMELGYKLDDIKKMTPKEAHEILNRK